MKIINKKLSLIILASLALTACSTGPKPKTQYYLLANYSQASHPQPMDNGQLNWQLARLPDYLQQPSLVMQTSTHQLHFSNYHLWGENLAVAIPKVLTTLLGTPHNKKPGLSTNITVSIEHFYPTASGQVVLSGHYQKTENNVSTTHPFNYQQTLTQSGFEQAVSQQKQLLLLLAEDIKSED